MSSSFPPLELVWRVNFSKLVEQEKEEKEIGSDDSFE